MTLHVELVSSGGNNKAKINGEGELNVVVHPHPPVDETVTTLPFRQFFTQDGTSTGISDMLVDGSSTNVEYYIKAIEDYDIYLKTLSVAIVDASATLNKFGNLTALTNGIEFFHETLATGTTVINDAIKTNFDFVRQAMGQPAFGDGSGAFRANNVVSTAEGYLPVIDLAQVFGLPWGLRLKKGSQDRLVFTIKDDLSTGMTQFDIVGYGIRT